MDVRDFMQVALYRHFIRNIFPLSCCRGGIFTFEYIFEGGEGQEGGGEEGVGLKIKLNSLNFKSKLVKAQRSLCSDLIDLVINLPC